MAGGGAGSQRGRRRKGIGGLLLVSPLSLPLLRTEKPSPPLPFSPALVRVFVIDIVANSAEVASDFLRRASMMIDGSLGPGVGEGCTLVGRGGHGVFRDSKNMDIRGRERRAIDRGAGRYVRRRNQSRGDWSSYAGAIRALISRSAMAYATSPRYRCRVIRARVDWRCGR